MLQLTLTGNIGTSARLVDVNGTEYISFTVAHSTGRDDNRRTTWVSVLRRAGNNPNIQMQYLKTGAKVLVVGGLTAKAYTAKSGASGVDLTVFANEIEILVFPKDDQQNANAASNPSPRPNPATVAEQEGDDLPF